GRKYRPPRKLRLPPLAARAAIAPKCDGRHILKIGDVRRSQQGELDSPSIPPNPPGRSEIRQRTNESLAPPRRAGFFFSRSGYQFMPVLSENPIRLGVASSGRIIA